MATKIDCDLHGCIHNPDDLGPCTAYKVELTIDPETGFLACYQYETEKRDDEDADQEAKLKMGVRSIIKNWYNGLIKEDKLKVIERFNELMAEKGMILVGGEGTLCPNHELPHEEPESLKQRRARERKEKKIGDKWQAKAVGEMYLRHIKGKF